MEASPAEGRTAGGPAHPKKYKEHVRTIGAEFRDMSGPIRRLIIHKVVLNNFKSYGGETTIGPFHKRFTSIVGPNGSGKSNVIDAMLFVFGFRAKQIRFDKLSELIHNSKYYMTKNKGRPLESMKVAIHFVEILDRDPDSDEYELIEGTELVVSREVSSDNSSKYRLNGTVCTQKQISNALKSYGMDLYNNRFLILQGEVEQISQMKPKATKPDEEGLLEYLEDIIGTNQYLEQINRAFEKYEELQEQYQQFHNRTAVTQNEIQDMLPGKQEADAYLAKENTYHKYNYLLLKGELAGAQREAERAADELEAVRAELRAHDDEVASAVEQKNELAGSLKELEAEMQKLASRQREYGEEFKKFCNRDEDLRMQLLHEVKKVEEKTKMMKALSAKIPDLERRSKEKLDEADALKKRAPELQRQLEEGERALEETRSSFAAETERLMRSLQVFEKELAPVQERYDAARNELESIETNLQLVEQSTGEDESRKLALEADLATTRTTLQVSRDGLKSTAERMESCSQRAQRISSDLVDLERKIAETNSNLIAARVAYESRKNELGQSKFHSSVNEFVQKMARTERGIHGQFGELVRVEDRFQKSFLAVCGPFLDVFVVETPEVATKIFSQLRLNNLGKVTCIAVSIIAPEGARDSGRDWGRYGHLSKYVFPSAADERAEKVLRCIHHYTKDVVVVENLDEADELARRSGKRVVTLEGEVIERDGRITGGGLNRNLSRFKQSKKQDKDDMSVIYSKMEQYDRELKELRSRQSRLHIERDQNELQIRELSFTLDATRRKISSDEEYLGELEGSLEALARALKSSDAKSRAARLRSELEETRRRKEEVYEQLVQKKLSVDRCLQEVENVGGGAVAARKARVAECEAELASLRTQIEDSREQYAALAGESQKYSRDLTRLESDVQQHKSREKSLEGQLDQLEEEASKVNEALIRVNGELGALKDRHSELSASLQKMAAQIKQHDMRVLDLRHRQDKCGKSLAALKAALKQKTDAMNESKKLFNSSLKTLSKSNESNELYAQTMKLDTLSVQAIENGADEPGNQVEPGGADQDGGETPVKEAPSESEAGAMDLDLESGDGGSGREDVAVKKEGADDIDEEPGDMGSLGRKIQALKSQLANVPNLSVIDTFAEKVKEFAERKQKLLSLQSQRDEAKLLHENLSFKRKSEFLFNFEIIASKLKEIYQMITLGGDAELELVDSTEPFTEGVLFSVRPVKKSWKQIYNLSGGEKTLSSLALVFALHHYKPNPVYFMDEIDAALDFRNVSIIAQSIKERTKDAQFIIISLRNQMFEMCNKMVGIYKTFDVTKSIAINPLSYKKKDENTQS